VGYCHTEGERSAGIQGELGAHVGRETSGNDPGHISGGVLSPILGSAAPAPTGSIPPGASRSPFIPGPRKGLGRMYGWSRQSSTRCLLRLGSLGPSTVTLIACVYAAYCTGSVATTISTDSILPLPERPTNLRSLKRATWFLNVAVALRSSAALFSSFPAVRITLTPSLTSLRDSTLNGDGRVLLHRQCAGSIEHTKLGELVRTSSPGCSARTSENVLSTRKGSEPCAAAVEVAAPFSLGGDAIFVLPGLLLAF
jgi:hypothetical protein